LVAARIPISLVFLCRSFGKAVKCVIESLVDGLKMGVSPGVPHLAEALATYMNSGIPAGEQ